MDVGDYRIATLTIDPADGTTAATLLVTKPDGSTVSPTVGAPVIAAGVGTATAAAYLQDQAGMWIEKWTVTGTGKGVEIARPVVNPAASPIAAPTTNLATIEDLLYRKPDLTAAQIAQAPILLADASAKIRKYTRLDFTPGTSTVILRPVGTKIRLPQWPITSITSVKALLINGLRITLPQGLWVFDGIDQIDVASSYDFIINLPDLNWFGTYAPDTYEVVYAHGSSTIPGDVNAVCCGMVLRVLISASPIEGMSTEHVGQYSYQMNQQIGGGSPGLAVRLTEADKLDLADYRPRARTVQVGL